jgi:8-oxo-dGTP pyrophosphatase MutT (NUDIX family)
VVLLDRHRRVLLLCAADPFDRRAAEWWEIPGGGQDPGETSQVAATRELFEETGITEAEIGPCVWVQHAEFDFGGYHFDQRERIHVAWCDEIDEIRPAHLEALEALAFRGSRWWTLDELLASDVPTLPPALRTLLPDLVAGRLPDPPLDITGLTDPPHDIADPPDAGRDAQRRAGPGGSA